jgi:hypothetical protein
MGNTKNTFYTLPAQKQLDNNWKIIGVSKKHTPKSVQKLPDKTNATISARFEPQKRNFRNGHQFDKNFGVQKVSKIISN